MYCILVTGIPASGKTTMAKYLASQLGIPLFSKDKIKEVLYDSAGFRSREEKVRLGIASMNIMYETARQLMKCGQPFILENNFENLSKEGLTELLETYSYTAITVSMTGDYKTLYQRFMERNSSPDRHPGPCGEYLLSGERRGTRPSGVHILRAICERDYRAGDGRF